MTDDLDALLSPSRDAGSQVQRTRLLAASTRILRRRYIVRRIGSAFVIISIFALGGTAGWLLKPPAIEKEYVNLIAPPPPESQPPSVPVALSPHELEQRAELADDKAEVARLYREAGDKYLNDLHDYEQASRCYRLHLNAASGVGQRVAAEDSWLLMSMKNAIHKENSNANPGS